MAITADRNSGDTGLSHAGTAGKTPLRRHDYLSLRQRFDPEIPRLVIVAESPPTSGLYFYNPDGAVTEPLFAALMKALGLAPAAKLSGLRTFQRRGWVLVDATYEPVNKLSKSERDAVIVRDYPLLRRDLEELTCDQAVPLVLIKANVRALLEQRLTADGLQVLNHGQNIPFPSHGWQKDFQRKFGAILKSGDF